MTAMFQGRPVIGLQGAAGPDGNPIGTIISYMGLTAPKDYLVCDGKVYNIADYSNLAEFFQTQFGTKNYFGGDGTTTFAVPDMRNLFLRGFHGVSTDQLSGDIGIKQDATEIPNFHAYKENNTGGLYCAVGYDAGNTMVSNQDSYAGPKGSYVFHYNVSIVNGIDRSSFYTVRPVNMAVLYCIKATVAESYENSYSTEETRIGTWIDGKPIYRKVFTFTTGGAVNVERTVASVPEIETLVNHYAWVCQKPLAWTVPIPSAGPASGSFWTAVLSIISENVSINVNDPGFLNCPGAGWIDYTKTTDVALASQATLLTSEVSMPETLSVASVASHAPASL